MTTTQAPALHVAEKIDGSGLRHIVKPAHGMNVATFCTGRTIRWMVPTDGPVTCAACVKRAAREGISVECDESRNDEGCTPGGWAKSR